MNFTQDGILKEMLVQNLHVFNSVSTHDPYHMLSLCLVRQRVAVEINIGDELKYVVVGAALFLVVVSFVIMYAIF